MVKGGESTDFTIPASGPLPVSLCLRGDDVDSRKLCAPMGTILRECNTYGNGWPIENASQRLQEAMAQLQEIQNGSLFLVAWLDSANCGVRRTLPDLQVLRPNLLRPLSCAELCRRNLPGKMALPEMREVFLRPMALSF
jgi:hypothetical protein